jgi:hypothetical protein
VSTPTLISVSGGLCAYVARELLARRNDRAASANCKDGEDGAMVHSEVCAGDVVLMVSADETYETPPLIGRSVGDSLSYICVFNNDLVE